MRKHLLTTLVSAIVIAAFTSGNAMAQFYYPQHQRFVRPALQPPPRIQPPGPTYLIGPPAHIQAQQLRLREHILAAQMRANQNRLAHQLQFGGGGYYGGRPYGYGYGVPQNRGYGYGAPHIQRFPVYGGQPVYQRQNRWWWWHRSEYRWLVVPVQHVQYVERAPQPDCLRSIPPALNLKTGVLEEEPLGKGGGAEGAIPGIWYQNPWYAGPLHVSINTVGCFVTIDHDVYQSLYNQLRWGDEAQRAQALAHIGRLAIAQGIEPPAAEGDVEEGE